MRKGIGRILGWIAAILCSAGCVSEPLPPLTAAESGDSELAAAVRERLASDPETRKYVVGVSVFRGNVTLSGAAPLEIRARAIGIARNTPGVRAIEDRMTDRAPAAVMPPTR